MATVKLNQWTRDAIVRAILDDIPKPDEEKVKAEAQAALVKAMSPTARKLYRENPRALRGWSTYDLTERSNVFLVIGDADPVEVLKPWLEHTEKRSAVGKQIRQAVNSCSTVKQLEERFPEFAKYAPKPDAPTTNLPAVANLVTDLMNLGWPKPETT